MEVENGEYCQMDIVWRDSFALFCYKSAAMANFLVVYISGVTSKTA